MNKQQSIGFQKNGGTQEAILALQLEIERRLNKTDQKFGDK